MHSILPPVSGPPGRGDVVRFGEDAVDEQRPRGDACSDSGMESELRITNVSSPDT